MSPLTWFWYVVNSDLGQFGPRENTVRIDQGLNGVKVRINLNLSAVKARTDQSLNLN